MKKIILASALCSSLVFAASNPSNQYGYEVTAFTSGILSDSKVDLKDDNYLNVGLSVAKNLDNSIIDQIELGFMRSESAEYKNGSNTNMNRLFLNAVKKYALTEKWAAYGLAGLGNQDVSQEQGENEDSMFFNWGLGLRYDIPYYGIALKTDVRHLLSFENSRNDIMYTFGVAMPLGKKYTEKVEAKIPVVEEEKIEAKVPVIDGDDDNDGVLNSKDQCPNTPAGAIVDKYGCEVDEDNDGVVNRLDKCPNTSAGLSVNEEGCVATIDLNINFASNSDVIKNQYNSVINKFADILRENKNLKATIEAHTDSRGNDQYNKELSQRRANSAVEALQMQGIDASRLTAIGYGEAKPIATNETAEGRAQNRRVTGLINQ